LADILVGNSPIENEINAGSCVKIQFRDVNNAPKLTKLQIIMKI